VGHFLDEGKGRGWERRNGKGLRKKGEMWIGKKRKRNILQYYPP